MRLYWMYYMCKEYLPVIKDMKLQEKSVNNNSVMCIEEWNKKCIILNELAKIEPLRKPVRKFYETIPAMYRDKGAYNLSPVENTCYVNARTELIIAMNTVIDLYELTNNNKIEGATNGFDIKLPQFNDIGEFSKCLEDLDFVINQCPYLRLDSEIKYGSVDIGSTWLTFLIVGASATTMLYNLSKLVDSAVKIKSHATTVKMQEEALKSIQLKNEVASEVFNAFEQVNKVITNQCINELKSEISPLKDAEEEDKAGRSIKKLAYWMDKGLQIYSTIDVPDEIKDLFPKQEESSFLTDDIQKLIQMKQDTE